MSLTPVQRINLKVLAAAAVRTELMTGVPCEFIAAQCIVESAWLKIAPGNNCFGIKDYRGSHGRQLLLTREWFTDREAEHFRSGGDLRSAELVDPNGPHNAADRRQFRVYDWFATFPDLESCFAFRAARFVGTGHYGILTAAYRSDRNLEQYVTAVARSYATSPNYATLIMQIIRTPEVVDAIQDAREDAALDRA